MEWFYLKLWSNATTESYVNANELLCAIGLIGIDIIKKFFSPYSIYLFLLIEDKVSMTTYMEFICIFAFFPYKQLIHCIISIF